MHDSGAGRNNFELVKCALSPAQELVALLITFVFELDISVCSIGGSKKISNHRVVNHKFDGVKGLDLVGVSTEFNDGLAHCR